MRQVLPSLLAVTCCAIGLQTSFAATPQPHYRVTILSSSGASGNAINDWGLVSGSHTLSSLAVHATAWAFGSQVDLGTLGSPSLNSTVLWPVKNQLGLISGISLTDQLDPNREGWSCGFFVHNPDFNVCLGFVWDPVTRQMRALPTLGGTNGFATGTNDLGQTVGWAETSFHDPSCAFPQVLQFKPTLWGPGRNQVRALPLVSGDSSGAATAINNRGQVVGISGACGIAVGGVSAAHAVIWENGVATVLENPNGAPYWNTPMMINENGDVVGFAGFPGDTAGNLTPPFMWTHREGWKFLPVPSGDIAGIATSINERGEIVGYSNDASGNLHPLIWIGGKPTNLNDLVEPGSGLTGPITLAFDINDRGEITGTTLSGQAFVAIPQP